ncbi:MAG: adenine phosphoribosyltransferase, partial [Pseudomonadota bacterium]|nr:adenine phosphoribosyltransferase [Pseudomonadota bacterium]
QLCQKCGHQVLGAVILLDLPDLHADLGLSVWHVLDNKSEGYSE